MIPAIRRDLDIMPSPVEDRPGILIRDPMGYSSAVIIIPWELAPCLDCFDGRHTELDLRQILVHQTGQLTVSDLQEQLMRALSSNAFLEDEVYAAARETAQREFAAAPTRVAAHDGSAYPEQPEELHQTMRGYIDPALLGEDTGILGIASPHVSPFGGWQSYLAAYRALPRDVSGRTFVILGTSHYGEPEKFGLTRKAFQTPLGSTATDTDLVERLLRLAPGAITEEDYCHSVEHSIEFQVLFLQWLYGPDIRILPILCGAFVNSIYRGGKPEDNDAVARFLGELGRIGAEEKDRLLWVLGIDMAHIGKRYGDPHAVTADQGFMTEIALRDRDRAARVTAGDADGFWERVQHNRDDLRWCGSSPLYTFLKACPQARGQVERYEQWNIDDASVVSFAGITFHE